MTAKLGSAVSARHGLRLMLAGAAVMLTVPLFAVALPAAHAAAASRSVTVSVPATHWKYIGLSVKAGQVLRISATGTWTDGSTTSGPGGSRKLWPDNFFNLADLGACSTCATTKTSQWGGLIGYIGDSPPPAGSYTSTAVRPQALRVFYIGRNYEALVLESGKLWLSKNADAYSGFTVDNSGHVVAKVTVLPPETRAEVAARARTAALAVDVATPLKRAANFCGRAVFDAFSQKAVEIALEHLLHLDGISGVFDGATITGDTIQVDYELSNGEIGQATFDFGQLVFEILGHVPGFTLFGIVGAPAIQCAEAGFWLSGNFGSQLGQYLRQKLWPPSTASAGIAGTWTLARTIVTCVNFPAGCSASPMKVRFSHCRRTTCVMAWLGGFWKRSHTITLKGRLWAAHFTDIAIDCGSRRNPADLTIKLVVTSAHKHNGLELAKTLGGTYTVAAAANPPNCPANGRGVEDLHGSRS